MQSNFKPVLSYKRADASPLSSSKSSEAILVLAPTGKDAFLAAEVLKKAGLTTEICIDLPQLCKQIHQGEGEFEAGVILLAEEALIQDKEQELIELLNKQPAWSDVPIVVLTSGGESTRASLRALDVFGSSGNVTLLERPLQAATLISAMQVALRSRRRQYEIRDLLEQREAVLSSITDSYYSMDENWIIEEINQKALDYFGRTRDQVLGRSFFDAFPETKGTDLEKNYLRARAEQRVAEFELRSLVVDRWAEIHVYPSGNRLSVYFRDITERKEAEEALRISRERLDLIIQASQLGLWYCDLPFDKMIWNDTVKKHFGFPLEEEITIQKFFAHLHPDDRSRTEQEINRAIQTREPYDTEYRTIGNDGTERWVRAIGRAFFDEEGIPKRFDGITVDITTQKEAAKNLLKQTTSLKEKTVLLEEARRDAESANKMKDQFLATLSHELRTPLNAILGWGQVLREELEQHKVTLNIETFKQGIEVIERNGRVQAQLIEDLLDVSRIISGKLLLDLKYVKVGPVIEAAGEAIRPQAEEKGVELKVEIPAGPVPTILADSARLQQIIWNLLSNAVKFTSKGGHVCIELSQVENNVKIMVRDTGQGVSPEFLPHVFERFRQADPTTTRKHGGLGLGLSIVHQLVDLLKGSVKVESEGIDRGTTFTLTFPIVKEPQKSTSDRSLSSAGKAVLPEDGSARRALDGIRVLVVDNEPDARELIRKLLIEANAEVEVAGSVKEALNLINAYKPDILVSDIGMPNEDGYDLIRKIRESSDSINKIPAVALTAFASMEDKNHAKLAGFQVHLAKPVDPDELRTVIAALT